MRSSSLETLMPLRSPATFSAGHHLDVLVFLPVDFRDVAQSAGFRRVMGAKGERPGFDVGPSDQFPLADRLGYADVEAEIAGEQGNRLVCLVLHTRLYAFRGIRKNPSAVADDFALATS